MERIRAGDAAVEPANQSLTVGTYNVYGFGRIGLLRQDMQRLPHVDVWALQEVPADAGGSVPGLGTILADGGWHVAILSVNAEREGYEAQVIASRMPISDLRVWPLPAAGAKRRAALAAQISTPGGKLLVVNTDHEPEWLLPIAGHRQQVRALLGYLDREAGPIVVLGDFNPSGSLLRGATHVRERRWLAQQMHRHGYQRLPVEPATYRAGIVSLQLDQIFLAGVTATRWGVASDNRGSDHSPVWCEINMPVPSPP